MIECLFVSNTCSKKFYSHLQSLKYSEKLNPSQKYFHMLIEGLNSISDCQVKCISARSIDVTNSNVKSLQEESDFENGIEFIYTPIINKKILKNINNFVYGYKITKRLITGKDRNSVVLVCDPLSYDISLGALFAARKIKKCGILTDLPYYMAQIKKDGKRVGIKKKLRVKLTNIILNRIDMFCFLTESMNKINHKNKPYVVIEGMVYSDINISINDVTKNIVLYAGGLYEQFGINALIEAAKQVKLPDFEMHFYGEGNLVETIESVEKAYPNICYKGVLSLDEIMNVESEARVLINPRPSIEEFTEYSFPSKTLEYLSSGRPVLTTRLKGIPSEYFEYLYIIEDETIIGIRTAIEFYLKKTNHELNSKGINGYEFVKRNKNNKVQARRLWDLLITEKTNS